MLFVPALAVLNSSNRAIASSAEVSRDGEQWIETGPTAPQFASGNAIPFALFEGH